MIGWYYRWKTRRRIKAMAAMERQQQAQESIDNIARAVREQHLNMHGRCTSCGRPYAQDCCDKPSRRIYSGVTE